MASSSASHELNPPPTHPESSGARPWIDAFLGVMMEPAVVTDVAGVILATSGAFATEFGCTGSLGGETLDSILPALGEKLGAALELLRSSALGTMKIPFSKRLYKVNFQRVTHGETASLVFTLSPTRRVEFEPDAPPPVPAPTASGPSKELLEQMEQKVPVTNFSFTATPEATIDNGEAAPCGERSGASARRGQRLGHADAASGRWGSKRRGGRGIGGVGGEAPQVTRTCREMGHCAVHGRVQRQHGRLGVLLGGRRGGVRVPSRGAREREHARCAAVADATLWPRASHLPKLHPPR